MNKNAHLFWGLRASEIRTRFESRSGAPCGEERVSFVRVSGTDSITIYRVDNRNLRELLALVANCATE